MTTHNERLDTAIGGMGNRYLTTMLIAKRIRQLHHGAPPRVERRENESNFSVAVREIAGGLVALEESSDTSDASNNGTGSEESPAPDKTPPE